MFKCLIKGFSVIKENWNYFKVILSLFQPFLCYVAQTLKAGTNFGCSQVPLQQNLFSLTFESIQINKKLCICHKISCKSNYVIFLLECLLCKIQYAGKSETPFHIRLNNHRKDIKSPHAIEPCKHFINCNHLFHKHVKFILIEQLNNTKNTSTEVLKQKVEDRENYRTKKLKTLAPSGLNQELN